MTTEKKAEGGKGGGGEKKKKKKGKKAIESPKMNVVTVFTGLLSRLKKIREENIVKRELEVRAKDDAKKKSNIRCCIILTCT